MIIQCGDLVCDVVLNVRDVYQVDITHSETGAHVCSMRVSAPAYVDTALDAPSAMRAAAHAALSFADEEGYEEIQEFGVRSGDGWALR